MLRRPLLCVPIAMLAVPIAAPSRTQKKSRQRPALCCWVVFRSNRRLPVRNQGSAVLRTSLLHLVAGQVPWSRGSVCEAGCFHHRARRRLEGAW